MKIAHISVTFPPYRGGTGNVCYNNARELVKLGHDVHVYTARVNGANTEEEIEGIRIHRLQPALRYGNAAFLPSLIRHLRNFDILHLHSPFYGGAESVQLLRTLTRIPLVITHHQDAKLNGKIGWISKSHDYLLGRKLLQQADVACFTSQDYALSSQFADLVRSGKIRAAELPNGVDPVAFSPGNPRPEMVERFDLDSSGLVLFVGALDKAHYFKGIPTFLKAMASLDRPLFRFVVVGNGDLLPEYKRLAAEYGLDDRVYFIGSVSDADLIDYYRLADVTVLPSTTSEEAFGLVLIESMACGTPVIASNLPGVRTVVDEGEDGLLVRPGDAADLKAKIVMILHLPAERRQEMGLAGRRKVEGRYSWQQIGARLESLYFDVLGQSQLARNSVKGKQRTKANR